MNAHDIRVHLRAIDALASVRELLPQTGYAEMIRSLLDRLDPASELANELDRRLMLVWELAKNDPETAECFAMILENSLTTQPEALFAHLEQHGQYLERRYEESLLHAASCYCSEPEYAELFKRIHSVHERSEESLLASATAIALGAAGNHNRRLPRNLRRRSRALAQLSPITPALVHHYAREASKKHRRADARVTGFILCKIKSHPVGLRVPIQVGHLLVSWMALGKRGYLRPEYFDRPLTRDGNSVPIHESALEWVLTRPESEQHLQFLMVLLEGRYAQVLKLLRSGWERQNQKPFDRTDPEAVAVRDGFFRRAGALIRPMTKAELKRALEGRRRDASTENPASTTA